MQSKMEIGRAYRVQTMQVLARLGYATTRQVSMCLFGGCSDSERKQAGRTIRKLLSLGHVVEKRSNGNVSSERMIALTRAGVAALGEDVELIAGRAHARDWLRHAHGHRTACNSVWAACYRGLTPPGWTELEIRAGAAPRVLSMLSLRLPSGEVLQKIPDLLLESYIGDAFPMPVWAEVENAWRGPKDFDKLVRFLRALFSLEQPLIHQVWFIITASGAKSIGKRLRTAIADETGRTTTAKARDVRMLAECIKVFQLDSENLDLVPILW